MMTYAVHVYMAKSCWTVKLEVCGSKVRRLSCYSKLKSQ